MKTIYIVRRCAAQKIPKYMSIGRPLTNAISPAAYI